MVLNYFIFLGTPWSEKPLVSLQGSDGQRGGPVLLRRRPGFCRKLQLRGSVPITISFGRTGRGGYEGQRGRGGRIPELTMHPLHLLPRGH